MSHAQSLGRGDRPSESRGSRGGEKGQLKKTSNTELQLSWAGSLTDLLGIGQGPIEPLADNGEVLRHLLVVDVVALFPIGHLDLLGERRIADTGHAALGELQQSMC